MFRYLFRYLLDANVVIPFQKANCLEALASTANSVPMAMVSDVLDELTIPKTSKEPVTKWHKEADRALRSSSIEIIEVFEGTDEDAKRNVLQAFVDKGEAASTAVAAVRLELIFVTEDANAIAKLYRELPGDVGRIMGLHAFLRVLVERGAFTGLQAKSIEQVRSLQSPLWWSDWLANVCPKA